MNGLFGWVAFALNVVGNLMLTGKTGAAGWLVRLLVNVLWIPYSLQTRAWALLANHLTFMTINVYGWWKWRFK